MELTINTVSVIGGIGGLVFVTGFVAAWFEERKQKKNKGE
ncbi:hypothetical protein ES705_34518 [subsurface metagenome]